MKGHKIRFAELLVKEVKTRDFNRLIGRIDKHTMEMLNIQVGEPIALIGAKLTTCIAWPCHPKDKGLGLIHISPKVMKNAGISVNDTLRITKCKLHTAQRIALAPIGFKIKEKPEFNQYLHKKLYKYPITEDDIIYLKSIWLPEEIRLKVMGLVPKGICFLRDTTEIILMDQS